MNNSDNKKPSLLFNEQHLMFVTSDVLKKMVRIWGGKGNEAKESCVRRIIQGLADENAIRAALSFLDPMDRAALALLKENDGVMQAGVLHDFLVVYGYLTEEEKSNFISFRGETSNYVARLIQRGYLLLVPGYTSYSPYSDILRNGVSKSVDVYIDDRFLRHIDWPLEVLPLSLMSTLTPPSAPKVRGPLHVTLDLMAITRTLAEIKQLSITKSGFLRVSDKRKFQKRMRWEDTQTFDGNAFPDIAYAVIAAWIHAGWLRDDEDAVTLSITPECFAKQPLLRQVTKLVKGIVSDANWSELPDIQSYHMSEVRVARYLFLHGMRTLPDIGQWYTVPQFLNALFDRVGEMMVTRSDYKHRRPSRYGISDKQYQVELTSWKNQRRPNWVEMETEFAEATLQSWMYWLGFVEIGRLEDKSLTFRLTDLGRAFFVQDYDTIVETKASPAWVVQPNFDIVVYLDIVTQEQLAFLEQYAERRQTEKHTAHYQLTRESVYRGLESGTTMEDMLTTLKQGSREDLPQNIERELQEWAGQRERITLTAQARVISFPSSETRAQALEAGLRGTPVGETYVLIKEGAQIKTVLKAIFGLQNIPAINYAQEPVKCLMATEDGRLILNDDEGDILIYGQLSRFAEQVDDNNWRITPASLVAAKKAGVTTEILTNFLKSRAKGVVPPLLEIVIGNALGVRDIVQAETALALRISNRKLYTAITTSLMLQEFLLDIPGPDTILINLTRLEEFKNILAWMGIKLTEYSPIENRPNWLITIRDAKTQQRRRDRY